MHGSDKKYIQIFFVRKPEEKRHIGRPRCRSKDNIKILGK
jgi:hypothetical protein